MTIDELPTVPDLAMSPDRIEVMRAALVREIDTHEHEQRGPAKAGAHRPLTPAWLRSRPRLRIASGLALGVLAAALALNYAPLGAGPRQAASGSAPGSGFQAVLAASWTALPTGVTTAEADRVLAACTGTSPLQAHQVALAQHQGGVYVVVATFSGAQPSAVVCIGEMMSAQGRDRFVGGVATLHQPDFGPTAKNRNAAVAQEMTSFRPFPSPVKPTQDASLPDLAIGTASPQVAKVDVQTTDPSSGGTVRTVQAMVGGGIYLAWWPQQYAMPTKTTAYAADGSVLDVDKTGPVTITGSAPPQ